MQETPTDHKVNVEAFSLNTSGGSVGAELERVCIENELVIDTWSPIHLRAKLKELYWKPDKPATGASAFFEDTLRYLYMPRLKNRDVLAHTILAGAASRDFFGTSYGQTGDKFEGFQLGSGDIVFDETLLLIEPESAKTYEDTSRPPPLAPQPQSQEPGGKTTPVLQPPSPTPGGAPAQPRGPKAFHIAAEIPAATAKMRLIQLADEIVGVLRSDSNAAVRIVVEISAEFPNGVSETVKRAVAENARSLGLKPPDWE
jgi:hypothetical protein